MRVEAFGKVMTFPDDATPEEVEEYLNSNRSELDPDYGITDRIDDFARKSLGVDVDSGAAFSRAADTVGSALVGGGLLGRFGTEDTPDAADYARSFGSGANRLVSGIGYLAEAAGADETGKAIREFGTRGAEYWNRQMSPAGQRAAQTQVFEDDPDSLIGLKLTDDWGQALMMGASQSAPSMLAAAIPGAAITKGIQGLAKLGLAGGAGATIPLLAGTAAPVGVGSQIIARAPAAVGFGLAEGGAAGSMNAAEFKSSIERMDFEELSKSPVFEALSAEHGPDTARELLAEEASSEVFGRTALSTGAIGALTGGGALGQAYQKITGASKGGLLSQIGRGSAQEAIQETPQSGGERLIENLATRTYLDPSQDPMEGVLAEAASGGAIGGLMGGVVGGAGAINVTRSDVDKITAQLNSEQTQAGINQIAEAGSVDEAIQAASNTVAQEPVKSSDIWDSVTARDELLQRADEQVLPPEGALYEEVQEGQAPTTPPGILGQEPVDSGRRPILNDHDLINVERTRQLQRELRVEGYGLDVEERSLRDFPTDDSKREAETASRIAGLFGKRLVPIKARGDFEINGVMTPKINDSIFINVDTKRPVHAVMGHELSHHMEQDAPDAYNEMVSALNAIIPDSKEYAERYEIQEGDQAVRKEIIGDIVGDNFTDEKFWKKVAEQNPTGFKKIADTIMNWLNNLVSKARARGMGSDQWVTDAIKAQDIVAKAVSQYTNGPRTDATEGGVRFGEGVAFSVMDYRGVHKAPSAERGDSPAHDLTDIFSKDIYSRDAARLYSSGRTDDKKVVDKIQSIRGNPDADIEVYRSIPKGTQSEINPGDWVTPNRDYAVEHGINLGEYDIISKKVKAGDIFNDGNSIQEWGYSPSTPIVEAVQQRMETPPGKTADIPESEAIVTRGGRVSDRKDVKSSKETIDVDGKTRPTKNSDNKPIYPTEEGIKNFWKWFSGSKITDDKGLPKVHYHTTSAHADFTEFRGSEVGTGAMFFSDNKDFVNELGGTRERTRIIPAYIKSDKPFDYRNESDRNEILAEIKKELVEERTRRSKTIGKEQAQKIYEQKLKSEKESLENISRGKVNWAEIEQPRFQRLLKQAGFDGFYVSEDGVANLAVYDPNQIKSATGNTGEFSKQESNVLFSRDVNEPEKTSKTTFDRFAELGDGNGDIIRALSDAKKITGLNLRLPIRKASLPKGVPAKLDVENGEIIYNDQWNFSRNDGAQFVAEELFHFIDVVSSGKSISSTSSRLNTIDGDIYLESKSHFKSRGKYYQYLAYPISEDLYPELSAHVRQAELFARLGVLYSGDLDKMKDHFPLAYEAYHGIFRARRIGDNQEVYRKVWSFADEHRKVGGQHGTAQSNAESNERLSRIRKDADLGRLHQDIAKHFHGNSSGDKVKFSRDDTKNLYVGHNLSQENLKHALELGGLAAPSLAINKAGNDFSSFGEITLLADPSLLETPKVKAFDADVYTPRHPRAVHDIDEKLFESFVNDLGDIKGLRVPNISELSESSGKSILKESPGVQYAWLKSQGKQPAVKGKNPWALREAITKRFRNKSLIKEYEKYIDDKFSGLVKGKKLFKGFTYSGTRRYVDYTMDNILKEMTKNLRGGEDFHYGPGNMRAAYAKQYKGVRDIAKDRDRVISSAEMNIIKEDAQNITMETFEALKPYYKYDATGFQYYDDASIAITEGPKGISEVFENDPVVRQKVNLLTDYLKGLPTEYFEAKAQRKVDLNEFNTAVVPRGTDKELINALKENGIKISYYKEGDQQSRTEAIQKASEKNNILFSREERLKQAGVDTEAARIESELPQETAFQAFRRQAQDAQLRFKVIQDWLKEQGVNLTEAANVYERENVSKGKTANKIEDFREKQLEPLIKEIAETSRKATKEGKFDLSDIATYLEAVHMPEANARSRVIHKDESATASGITDEQAKNVVDQFKAMPNFKEFKKLADRMRSVGSETLDMRLKAGLISQEQYDSYKATYEQWVPLRGNMSEQGFGKGMSVSAKEKRRKGHSFREDEFVIENLIQDREKAIMQIEKNKVALTVAEMLLEAQNEAIGTVGKPKKQGTIKDFSYVIEYKGKPMGSFETQAGAKSSIQKMLSRKDPAMEGESFTEKDFKVAKSYDPHIVMMATPMLSENEIQAYVNGHTIRLQLNDPLLERAATNSGINQVGAMMHGMRMFNRFLSKAYTAYSPDFLFMNMARDAYSGTIVLTGKKGAGFTAKVFGNYGPAISELIKGRRDASKSKWVTRYRNAGGNIGAAYLSDLERVGTDAMASLQEFAGARETYRMVYNEQKSKGAGDKKAHSMAVLKAGVATLKVTPVIGKLFETLNRVNSVIENALRLATFKTAIEQGDSDQQAAMLSKDLMNFNRKGEIANQMGALYLFFNPGMQGAHIVGDALFSSKHKAQVWSLLGGLTTLSFMLSELGRGDDDEREWENIPEYIKDRNMIFKIGDLQATVPVAYGFGMFHAMGNLMSDLNHGADKDQVAMRLVSAMFENFSVFGNPILEGEEGTEIRPEQLLMTIPKIVMGPSINLDGLGRPVHPTKYQESVPDSQLMWRSVRGTPYDDIATALNDMTGGSKYAPGAIDISPNTIKYWVTSLTGGAGRFVSDITTGTLDAVQGVPPELGNIPIARKFAREPGIEDTRQVFYKAANKSISAAERFSKASREGDREAWEKMLDESKPLIALAEYARAERIQAALYRDRVQEVQSDKSLSLKEKRILIRELELKENEVYSKFLNTFDKRVKE